MKTLTIGIMCVVQWIICFINFGCACLNDPVTTPMYFDLKPCDIVKLEQKVLLSGDGESAYRLYLYYKLGFIPDESLASYWLQKAGKLGNEKALHTLELRKTEPEKRKDTSSENTGEETVDPFN
jgi:hypothetical protein